MRNTSIYGGLLALAALLTALGLAQNPLEPAEPAKEETEEGRQSLPLDGLTGTDPCDQETLIFSGSLIVKPELTAEETSSVRVSVDASGIVATGEESGTSYTTGAREEAVVELGAPPSQEEVELEFPFDSEGRKRFTARMTIQLTLSTDRRVDASLGDVALECE